MFKLNKAFTLGEALFAVVVIGVIAAFTIPIVMQDSNSRETILKVKKAYTSLSNAYERAVAKHGSIIDWPSVDTQIYGDRIVNDINLGTNCQRQNNLTSINDCAPSCPNIYTAKEKTAINVCTSNNVYKFMSFDGFSYALQIEDPDCKVDVTGGSTTAPVYLRQVCGTIITDIYNSQKGRNKNLYGNDLFLFYITSDGIMPVGVDGDKTYPFVESDCAKHVQTNVFGCTARVLYGKEALFDKR